jgi:hypothetical protein
VTFCPLVGNKGTYKFHMKQVSFFFFIKNKHRTSRNFEVIFGKLNVAGICTSKNCSQKLTFNCIINLYFLDSFNKIKAHTSSYAG